VATGQELRRFVGHTHRVGSVMFAPDGRHAFSGSYDHTARLWDLESAQELRRFVGHRDLVLNLAVSADGRRLYTGSRDKTIREWHVATG
jgi:WD40 repeat protein